MLAKSGKYSRNRTKELRLQQCVLEVGMQPHVVFKTWAVEVKPVSWERCTDVVDDMQAHQNWIVVTTTTPVACSLRYEYHEFLRHT